MSTRDRFRGHIAGVGSASGVRVVVGRWHTTPLGSFADAMVETAAGHRVLLAPRQEVADFIAATYSFDEVRIDAGHMLYWDALPETRDAVAGFFAA